jgi:hypothetical protein
MKTEHLIRSWKEPDTRPNAGSHPAGFIDVNAVGGLSHLAPVGTATIMTMGCCDGLTSDAIACSTGLFTHVPYHCG